jgi:hypothetical protein
MGGSAFPDRAANGGWDYLPWLLNQFRQKATNTNQRLLDYFTVHYYPQSGEYGSDTSTAMQLTRNRSTRSLWDTNYVDASWINSVVMMIPRLKSWVSNYYPGTGIGITEYNWGAESHINGATAQADVLGIFGREGLDLATRWTTPDASTPTYKAMKLYRSYDGRRSTFGDVSVRAAVPNPDSVSAFAARAIDGRSDDGNGHQQTVWQRCKRNNQPYEFSSQWNRASLAVEFEQCDQQAGGYRVYGELAGGHFASADYYTVCIGCRFRDGRTGMVAGQPGQWHEPGRPGGERATRTNLYTAVEQQSR